jgi:hypothetical protein
LLAHGVQYTECCRARSTSAHEDQVLEWAAE